MRLRPTRFVAGVVTLGGAVAALVAIDVVRSSGSAPELRPLRSTPAAEQTNDLPRSQRALRALARAARADSTLAYTGTQYVTAWRGSTTASYVVDLTHRPGEGTMVQLRSNRPGQSRDIFEADDSRDARADALAVTSVDSGPLDLLSANFGLSIGPGTPSTVEVVATRANGVVAARFWMDKATGLLVRREVYDRRGALARVNAFVSFHVGRVVPMLEVSPAPAVSGTQLDQTELSRLRVAGWVVPELLPDGMVLIDAREATSAGLPVVHLSYSNGLSTLSLFVERGRLDSDELGAWQRQSMRGPVYVREDGLSERVVWGGDGMVYTVVADAPESDIAAAVARLPHHVANRSTLDRVGHGLRRLGSWLDPFH
jgi:sigma-E factor negative regulatory protein RseB